MKNNKNNTAISSLPQLDDQTILLQIETTPARIEELISIGLASDKPMNSFLAEKLHHGVISPQELIDTLRYFSLISHQLASTREH